MSNTSDLPLQIKVECTKNSSGQDKIRFYDFVPYPYEVIVYRTNTLAPPHNQKVWIDFPRMETEHPHHVARLAEVLLRAHAIAKDFTYYVNLYANTGNPIKLNEF